MWVTLCCGLPGLFRYILESVLGNSIEHFTDLSLGRNNLGHESLYSHLRSLGAGTEKYSWMDYLFQSSSLSYSVGRSDRSEASFFCLGWGLVALLISVCSAPKRLDCCLLVVVVICICSSSIICSAASIASRSVEIVLWSSGPASCRVLRPAWAEVFRQTRDNSQSDNKLFSPARAMWPKLTVDSGSAFMFHRSKF